MKALRKLFGGIDMTWPKVIVFAVVAGIVTGLIALSPQLKYTSLHNITVNMEMWILLGLIVVLNSKSNLDAALKAFVFFLISQPIVYLVQVPFVVDGWGIFKYYGTWFIWTLLCFPMGYVEYFIKKDKWWSYLLLLPAILLLACLYAEYVIDFMFAYPFYVLSAIFCAACMVVFPLAFFENKKIRIAGVAVSAALIIVATAFALTHPYTYSTYIGGLAERDDLNGSYAVSLEDPSYGDVRVESLGYYQGKEDFTIAADFKRGGNTVLILESPDGDEARYDIVIHKLDYSIERE